MDKSFLEFNTCRRFGVEIEVNAFDGKEQPAKDKLPEGIHYVGNLVAKTTKEHVELRRWYFDRHLRDSGISDRNCWVVKPDSSCGIEICSPISKGWHGLMDICRVIDALGNDNKIKADHRCSLHVHAEIADCTIYEIASIITYWIKCEPVIIDSVPHNRKNNRYCEFIGAWDMFQHDTVLSPEELIVVMGLQKYFSMNSYHYHRGKRQTIEFRLGEGKACKSPFTAKNWLRFILHFVEMSKNLPLPLQYKSGDQWSSFLWLDPEDVFKILGFNGCLSSGLSQVRDWFLGRLIQNASSMKYGILSREGRKIAHSQTIELIQKYLGTEINEALVPANQEMIYSEYYRV